ncbi:hypothetical protein ABVK25_007137 [Lepraria finkii]|uniref:Uncharacterized protein n=1 Tax=Lepraria finkii TaxID=1340010 RepID=A0ABR4B5G8_9LECA
MRYLDDMRDNLATYLPDPRFAGSTLPQFTHLEMTALRKYEHQDLLLLCCLYTILRGILDVDLQRRSVRSHNFIWEKQAQFPLPFFLAGLNAVSDIMVQPGYSNRSRRMASHLHRTHATNPNLAQNTSQLVLLPHPLTPLLNRQLPVPAAPLDNLTLNLLGINGLLRPGNFNAVTHITQYLES